MFDNIIQAVRQHSIERPEKPLFTFLREGDDDAVSHTPASLNAAASIAAELRPDLKGNDCTADDTPRSG